MQDNILNISFVKVGNNLKPTTEAEKLLFKEFVNNLAEGQVVKFFLEADDASQSKKQLAKIHVCIRKLATEMGYTFEEMKLEIKRKAGLAYGDLNTSDGYVKSFADCSNDEITLVFEALNEAGALVNLQF
jgi:hypothetical protein